MSSSSVLGLLTVWVLSAGGDPQQMEVKPGRDAALLCEAHTNDSVSLLEWSRPDLQSDAYVFFYRNKRSYENYQHDSYRGRVALRDPEMVDGDVSVVLKNCSLNDSGTYSCRVIISKTGRYERTHSEIRCFIYLKVTDSGLRAELKNEEKRDVHVQLVAGVSVAVGLVVCIFAVFICRKREKRHSYRSPAVNAGGPVT